jgi:16S rRNA (cytosine1402-N4)-methyltransferase
MVDEVLEALRVEPGGVYIDCTVGEGGHSLALLGSVSPRPRLLGIDLDEEALTVARARLMTDEREVTLTKGNFSSLGGLAEQHGFVPADGVLFDLGVSSLQLETASRGFSFSRKGQLDMTFDVHKKNAAGDLVNRATEKRLAETIRGLGQEPRARRIARAIVEARPIKSTVDLSAVVMRAAGRPDRRRIHPATRTFQALRMAVNSELENLTSGLSQAVQVLAGGGRLAVISYHSLEDGLVKRTFKTEASDCICPPQSPQCVCGHKASMRVITRRVLRPTAQEVDSNPRSRSARVRVAERL